MSKEAGGSGDGAAAAVQFGHFFKSLSLQMDNKTSHTLAFPAQGAVLVLRLDPDEAVAKLSVCQRVDETRCKMWDLSLSANEITKHFQEHISFGDGVDDWREVASLFAEGLKRANITFSGGLDGAPLSFEIKYSSPQITCSFVLDPVQDNVHIDVWKMVVAIDNQGREDGRGEAAGQGATGAQGESGPAVAHGFGAKKKRVGGGGGSGSGGCSLRL